MKRSIFTIIILCAVVFSGNIAHATGPSITLTTDGANDNYPDQFNVDCGDTGVNIAYFFHNDGSQTDGTTQNPCPDNGNGFPNYKFSQGGNPSPAGTRVDVFIGDSDTAACAGVSEDVCLGLITGTIIPLYQTDLGYSLSPWSPPPTGLAAVVADSNAQFENTTGMTFESVTQFALYGLMNLIIGTAMLFVEYILPWILILSIIYCIIYFTARALFFLNRKY